MRILLIDAEGSVANRVIALFQGAGTLGFPDTGLTYELTHVHTSVEGFAAYQVIHPDLVLICCGKDDSESKQLCRNIRELEATRHTGVIFLASERSASDMLAVEFLESGADDVLRVETSDREIYARTNAVLKLKAMTDELRSANHRLHQLSYTDELTGLANMRAFNGRYSKAVGECFSGKCGLGVIMLDLDNFKNVNDTSNHLMGSHVIAEVGKIMRAPGLLSASDCAARFGGDEYVVFTLDASIDAVFKKAEDIRAQIQKASFVKDGKSMKITTSVGVSWTIPKYKGKAEDPIKAADLMLYKSKHEGRNRVSKMVLDDASLLEQPTPGVELRNLPKVS